MVLKLSKSAVERAGEGFDVTELLVSVVLGQVVHLGAGLVNANVAAGVRQVRVLQGAEKILSQYRAAGRELCKEGPGNVGNHLHQTRVCVFARLLMFVIV